MAIGTATIPELIVSMGTAVRSACVLSKNGLRKFQR